MKSLNKIIAIALMSTALTAASLYGSRNSDAAVMTDSPQYGDDYITWHFKTEPGEFVDRGLLSLLEVGDEDWITLTAGDSAYGAWGSYKYPGKTGADRGAPMPENTDFWLQANYDTTSELSKYFGMNMLEDGVKVDTDLMLKDATNIDLDGFKVEIYAKNQVPLPGAVWMLGTGLAAIGYLRKRRYAKSA